MKKIFLHVHDEKGYGHLSRMLKIYHSIKNNFDVCILVGGTLKIPDDSVKHIYLPYATELEKIEGDMILYKRYHKERQEFIGELLKKQGCFSILIDYFPFGRHTFNTEIQLIIEIAHKQGGKAFSIMRDIFTGLKSRHLSYYQDAHKLALGYSEKLGLKNMLKHDQVRLLNYMTLAGFNHASVNMLIEYYLSESILDGILVFGDSSVYDIRSEFYLSNYSRKKFYHLGYILPKDRHIKKSKGRYVLISAGGNIYDKEKFLQILMICSKIKNIHFKVILGSMIPDIEIKKIQNLVKASNIEFLDFSYNIKEYIIDAQLLIGCGGYGTVTDAMYYNIPALLYVNADNVVNINKTEQRKRIEILSKNYPIFHVEKIDKHFIKKILFYYNYKYTVQKNSINLQGFQNILKFLKG